MLSYKHASRQTLLNLVVRTDVHDRQARPVADSPDIPHPADIADPAATANRGSKAESIGPDTRTSPVVTALAADPAGPLSIARAVEPPAQPTSLPSAINAAFAARRADDLSGLYRMVALQEELDWLCYQLYGIEGDMEGARSADSSGALTPTVLAPDDVPPVAPGLRPFEIILARDDAERRAAIGRGEEASQQPTEWFNRHGWAPHVDTADVEAFVLQQTGDAGMAARYRAIVEERIERIEASKELSLVEQPTYKRRWYRPDHAAEEKAALEEWIADRLEAWAKTQSAPWTVRQAVVELERDAAVRAVAEVFTGRPDHSLEAVFAKLIDADAVPMNKYHVYTPKGLEKRAAWERTWELQHAEDRGEDVDVPVPPKYKRADFRKGGYWSLRGKLDVPKERFIAFTEMPGAEAERALFGWAGWTPAQRARVLLELDERAEQEGRDVEERYGLLYGAWFLLPWVEWESAGLAEEIRAVVQEVVGAEGVTEGMVGGWGGGGGRGGG